jgi:hypothetical protein
VRKASHPRKTGVKPVNQLTRGYKLVKTWDSVALAAEAFGIGVGRIYGCCAGYDETASGYRWEWHEETDLPGEEWVAHTTQRNGKDYEFLVSNMGRVQTSTGRRTYGTPREDGYLYAAKLTEGFRVHRIICEAFHPNPEARPTVDHLDRNNIPSNLAWATHAEQEKNRTVRGHSNGIKRAVAAKDAAGNETAYESIAAAARALGLKPMTVVSHMCRGTARMCGGYSWRYLEAP